MRVHVSFGPVQEFVAEARKTRDLWAGSYLLSYLAAHAIRAVIENRGRLVLPAVTNEAGEITDELLRAVCNDSQPPPCG
ncbi:MAG: type III-B CRISPR-associated protein Cas10/Cmr2, partial [Armatimonadetes bacterium]|nr:type III-B CRISPR-associated protein Cas10/Cmr2 [Armatimonadota bacterium]